MFGDGQIIMAVVTDLQRKLQDLLKKCTHTPYVIYWYNLWCVVSRTCIYVR
jgi:hypothetical protein